MYHVCNWKKESGKLIDFSAFVAYYVKVIRAMDLKGHSASVVSVSFSQDAKR